MLVIVWGKTIGYKKHKYFLVTAIVWSITLLIVLNPAEAQAFEWAKTELHYQYGRLDTPEFAGGGRENTHILTFQHASGWKYGDNYTFIDYLNDTGHDGFNDTEFYGEYYANFSMSKISGKSFTLGPIKDIGLLAGINFAIDAEVKKYLPGIRFSWSLPGFTFFNTDFTAYIDDSNGVRSGGAPRESDSFMIDVNWASPFQIGSHRFSIEGHIEYIGKRTNEFSDTVSDWVLGQPQVRYDLGNTLFNRPNKLFIGTECQFWLNKLGDKDTDEITAQALIVWRF
jgi:nucleoside-specific outer membrane channel protein Tsx